MRNSALQLCRPSFEKLKRDSPRETRHVVCIKLQQESNVKTGSYQKFGIDPGSRFQHRAGGIREQLA